MLKFPDEGECITTLHCDGDIEQVSRKERFVNKWCIALHNGVPNQLGDAVFASLL